jgi:histidine triad (HIT) family protein
MKHSSEDCIFCKIVQGKMPASKVYEDEVCMAFLDIRPVNTGHTLIIPKAHHPYLHELDENTGAHLFKIAMQIEKAIRASEIKVEGTNILQNNGKVAFQEVFQEVFHVHLHVIPRLKGDKMRFIIRQRPFPNREQLDDTAQIISNHL